MRAARYTVRLMSALQRFLLVCLLSLAIPLQGYAAAAMTFCGPTHERMAAAHAHADHGHAADGASHHGGHEVSAHAGEHVDDGLTHWQQLGDLDCSACAACCAAAVLPTSTPQLPLSSARAEPAPQPRLTSATFLTGGQERPPR